MPFAPRLLNSTVRILRPQAPTRDASGGPRSNFLQVLELPARVVLKAGTDRGDRRRDDHKAEGTCYLAGRPDVRARDRIEHNGKTFAIVGEPVDPHQLGHHLRIELMEVDP